ncbi:MAG: acyl carrier protein [Intrasporangium sp.]|uniref:acyl carrier protein n=1 Tax=Intrasporangium sp. TaxID=1925024 RepID=UPI002649B0F4|nr:acyl carrier protein [Intrasporangium sp.]MDN5794423.1 acyl carrier protein [Intrasporangium sp.]
MTELTAATHRTAVVEAIAASLTEVLGWESGPIDEQTSLVADIGLDSTGVLDLLMALEDRLGVEFDAAELRVEHFATVASLAAHIESLDQ